MGTARDVAEATDMFDAACEAKHGGNFCRGTGLEVVPKQK